MTWRAASSGKTLVGARASLPARARNANEYRACYARFAGRDARTPMKFAVGADGTPSSIGSVRSALY
jgi:hypothetical protein